MHRSLLGLVLLFSAGTLSAAISGSVIDENGKPISGAKVEVFAAEPSRPYRLRVIRNELARQALASTLTRGDGTFSVEAKTTAVDIVASTPGRVMEVVETVDGEDVGPIVLDRVRGPIRITAEGAPVQNAVVVFHRAVALRTDARGEVPDLMPGRAKLIKHPDHVMVALDGDETRIELIKGAPLRGRVVNAGGGAARAIVMLRDLPFAETRDDGSFAIEHAPPGSWELVAFTATEIGSAESDGDRPVEIRIQPAAAPRGRLVDAAGAPIAGARMRIAADNAPWRGEVVLSNANGEYAFSPALPRTPSTIYGKHPRFAVAPRDLKSQTDTAAVAQRLARIQGRVVDEKGAPVAGATVFAPGSRWALTASDGSFTLRAADLGRAASVHAQKQGYAIGVAPPRTWHDGDEINDVVITLPRGFPLQVKVVDARNQPVPRARVTVARADLDMFRDSVGSDAEGCPTCRRTDNAGIVEYRITEGEYRFLVQEAYDDRSLVRVGPVTLNARSSPYVITLTPPPVPAAGSRTAPASPPASAGRVAGRVIDRATGAAIQDFSVEVVETGRASVPRPFRAPDGSFVLDKVPAGKVTLRVAAKGYAPVTHAGVGVEEGKITEGVQIALDRGGRITGRVTSGGNPVKFATVVVRSELPGVKFAPAFTTAEGRYTLDGVPPGEWTVEVSGAGYPSVRRSIKIEGAEAKLDFEIDRGLELRGRVVDRRGIGLMGVDVDVLSTSGPFMQVSGRSGADGWFSISGLTPAHYKLITRKAGLPGAAIEIDLPSAEPVVVTVEPGASLSGRVSGVTAEDLPSLRVVSFDGVNEQVAVIDPRGEFVINGLPEGKVTLTATINRGGAERRKRKEIDVRAGLAPVVIDFGEGITVRGRITINGAPLRAGSVNFNTVSGPHAHAAGEVRGGMYEVAVPKAGEYQLSVSTQDDFRQAVTINVTETVTRDVEIRGPDLRGRVIDETTRAPLPGVRVSFSAKGVVFARAATTDSSGRFVLEAIDVPGGTLSARRQGYPPFSRDMTLPHGEIEVELGRGEEVVFTVVDALTGQPVPGWYVGNGDSIGVSAVRNKTTLAAGRYSATADAKGFVSQKVDFTVPPREVRIAMQKGVEIAFVTKRKSVLRLVARGSNEVVWQGYPQGNGVPVTALVAPGAYTLQVRSAQAIDVIEKTIPVDAVAGAPVTVPLD